MKFFTAVLALASAANAHTMLSELYINGESQGDATCIRTPKDGATSTSPVAGLTSQDMACDRRRVHLCRPGSAKLTFEFRQWPDKRAEGSIDPSHKGPCSVYIKKVDDMNSTAAGPGWFKIWDEGYDESTQQWCVDKLIANKGLLTVELPSGLPAGYYLVRPEVLALHQAVSLHDPQYYVGCAQVYIQDGPSGALDIPSEYAVSIPGYVDGSEPGNNFNLYDNPQFPYPVPGPKPYSPTGTSSGVKAASFEGGVPSDCLIKNANWCGKAVESYSTETGCWAGVDACYAQGTECFDSAPPTGASNCYVWNDSMCKGLEAQCRAKNFNGPPQIELEAKTSAAPGPIPGAVNLNLLGGSSNSNADSASSAAAASPSKTAVASSAAASSAAATPVPEYVAEDPVSTVAPVASVAPVSSAAPAPASSTVAAPAPSATNGLKVSTDGTCGGETGFTCEGSKFGACCSSSGKCGSKILQCRPSCGCQGKFGLCLEPSSLRKSKHN
ncbi:putative endo-beta-1,4-glucanase D [Colletotrichum spaethianum]|uniref:lytic cellulose monooxygenase (C4-dehydrogenating) n=1 Tax=Colletotrichum spaethianum TaxID=700344 RepID=A0AA37NZF2_9PEZI|nr:putative endo-beta-1,4-glucanase D [Colletotrichum spaethianum]GKT47257.1 putative endo-beta-1,4-glucanase D [Colletotrichum spaethianum]